MRRWTRSDLSCAGSCDSPPGIDSRRTCGLRRRAGKPQPRIVAFMSLREGLESATSLNFALGGHDLAQRLASIRLVLLREFVHHVLDLMLPAALLRGAHEDLAGGGP